MNLPSWWLEATVPGLVFGTMFVIWVMLPARPGHEDLGTRVRARVARLLRKA
jgi:hypothetical protein